MKKNCRKHCWNRQPVELMQKTAPMKLNISRYAFRVKVKILYSNIPHSWHFSHNFTHSLFNTSFIIHSLFVFHHRRHHHQHHPHQIIVAIIQHSAFGLRNSSIFIHLQPCASQHVSTSPRHRKFKGDGIKLLTWRSNFGQSQIGTNCPAPCHVDLDWSSLDWTIDWKWAEKPWTFWYFKNEQHHSTSLSMYGPLQYINIYEHHWICRWSLILELDTVQLLDKKPFNHPSGWTTETWRGSSLDPTRTHSSRTCSLNVPGHEKKSPKPPKTHVMVYKIQNEAEHFTVQTHLVEFLRVMWVICVALVATRPSQPWRVPRTCYWAVWRHRLLTAVEFGAENGLGSPNCTDWLYRSCIIYSMISVWYIVICTSIYIFDHIYTEKHHKEKSCFTQGVSVPSHFSATRLIWWLHESQTPTAPGPLW